MQSKPSNFHNTKLKAKKIVHTIWDGPGKFFIVIFISMFIVGIHESMKSNKMDTKFNMKASSLTAKSNLMFTTTSRESKMDMAEIIKKNQNKVQNEQEEEDLSVLLDMANQQMESERRRSNLQEEVHFEEIRNMNHTHEESFKRDKDGEILEHIIRDDAIYINI
jgi:hypothetical protein